MSLNVLQSSREFHWTRHWTYQLMRDGISDMHCMSELYLAEELKEEYDSKNL